MSIPALTPQLPLKPAVPWYKEPWPWLLMAGPFFVVVAGLITAVVAFRGADPLVAEDYYKQGLAINRVLERDQRAAALHVKAQLWYAADSGRVRVQLGKDGALPATLRLQLAHATRAQLDTTVMLQSIGAGLYEGPLPARAAGHWSLVIDGADWRVAGTWDGHSALLLDAIE